MNRRQRRTHDARVRRGQIGRGLPPGLSEEEAIRRLLDVASRFLATAYGGDLDLTGVVLFAAPRVDGRDPIKRDLLADAGIASSVFEGVSLSFFDRERAASLIPPTDDLYDVLAQRPSPGCLLIVTALPSGTFKPWVGRWRPLPEGQKPDLTSIEWARAAASITSPGGHA
jgi:hypothetical protein